jgi:hypothetical protein
LNIELLRVTLPGLILTLFMLGLATYNFVNGGIHVKGQWKTKAEAPKSYYVLQGILIFLALLNILRIASRLFF